MQFIFVVSQVEGYRNILRVSCRPLVFISHKNFLKNKKKFGTCFPGSISAEKYFLKKNISFIFYSLTKFHFLTAFIS